MFLIKKRSADVQYLISNFMIGSTEAAGNYMFKVNNRNARTRSEICSKVTISIPDGDANGVVLVSLLLTSEVLQNMCS